MYRAFLYAGARWYEERLTQRMEALPGIFAVNLGLVKDPKAKKGRKHARPQPHRPSRRSHAG